MSGDRFIVRLCVYVGDVFFNVATLLHPPSPAGVCIDVHKYIVIVMVYARVNAHAVQPNK